MFKTLFMAMTLPRLLFIGATIGMAMVYTLYDPDYYWHIKSGQYIVENLAIPTTDIFSYTMVGKDWVLHEWLFQVIVFLVHRTFTDSGLKLFSAMLIFWTTYNIFKLSKELATPAIATTCVLLFYPFLLLPFLAPRPQLFSYLFFSFFISFIIQEKYHNRKIPLLILPLIMIIWVNVHGGYIVGIALLMLYATTEFLVKWLRSHCLTTALIRIKRLGICIILTIIATGCNPEFYHHLLYPFQVITMDASRHIINEWQSPDFHDALGKAYLLFTFIFFVGEIYKDESTDFTELLLPLCFLSQGFFSVRHIPLALLVTTPFLCRTFKLIIAKYTTQQATFLSKKGTPTTQPLGQKEFILNWIILIFILVFFAKGAAPKLTRYTTAKASMIPEQAVTFITDNHITGRLFNTYSYGGYLIYRLFPQQKVFIDGRADMYGDTFVKQYTDIISGGNRWQDKFDPLKIDYIICRNTATLRQLVIMRGDFKLVYEDRYHSVLLKNNGRFRPLITKYNPSYFSESP